MDIEPYAPGCGALVIGIQLSSLTDTELLQIREAFVSHGLLFFRDQVFTPAEHLRFARRYGDIVLNKFLAPVKGFPDIAEVRKEKHHQTNIGGGWHTDHSYDETPALGSILVARDLPDTGGDTHFANLYAAYEALSPGLKKTLEGLRALHSNKHIYGKDGYYRGTDIADQLGGINDVSDATHPVVIIHPESGRKALYVNPGHTIQFEGWGFDESRALLNYLYTHVDQPQFTCQFDWQPGSVTFWDNRATWHFAQNDYQGQARLMHRITLAGVGLVGV